MALENNIPRSVVSSTTNVSNTPLPTTPSTKILIPVVPLMEEMAARIEPELLSIIRKPNPKDSKKYIVLFHELRNFWHAKDRDLFLRPWFDDERSEDQDNFLKVISILVMIRFRRWEYFREIFVDGQDRQDKDLPFKRDILTDDNFLGPVDGAFFYSNQWIFCPLVIRERREPYILEKDECERRLPFIGSPEKIGEGATAVVSMETVAPYHMQYSFRNRIAVNEEAKLVACKQLSKKAVPPEEFRNVVKLRGSVAEHNRIMTNIATIITESHYNILYDVAAYDLEAFLSENHNRLSRRDSAPRGHNNSTCWKPADLISECWHLADALDFLHSRLFGDDGEVACAHNDLKPENILVFYPCSPDEKYPVGQWKIADFGIAKVKPRKGAEQAAAGTDTVPILKVDTKRSSGKHLDVTSSSNTHRGQNHARVSSLSNTKSKRDPGRYTAPEVVGQDLDQIDARKGDIWSFGCIFSEVLVFSICQDLVQDFRRVCSGPTRRDMRFYEESTQRVKQGILPWLHEVSNRFPEKAEEGRQWIDDCVSVIQSILAPEDPLDRPRAQSIRNELKCIHDKMRGSSSSPNGSERFFIPEVGISMGWTIEENGDALSTHSGHSNSSGFIESPLQSPASSPPQSPTSMSIQSPFISLTPPNPEVRIPAEAAKGIRNWIRKEGSADYWVFGIPSYKAECQKIWRSTAEHIKREIQKRGQAQAIAYHRPTSTDPSDLGLRMVRNLIHQLDPNAVTNTLWRVDEAIAVLKDLLAKSPNSVVAIFYGINPESSNQTVKLTIDAFFELQRTCNLKLIFFTERRSETLEREIERSNRYDTSSCEPLKESLSELF
ncbi:hypothetical protein SLS57_012035 [Botryosphaeria dothidea]